MNPNGHKPAHQIIQVHPASESERIHGTRKPVLCHVKGFYDRDQPKAYTLATIPVGFTDQGYPSDVVWRAPEAVKVTRLDFTFDGRFFAYPVGVFLRGGEVLRLALAHLKLLDRFGLDVLGR